jgi:hypothetical protein
MRGVRIVVLLLLASCGDDAAEVSATVVHVTVTSTCAEPCYPGRTIEFDHCGGDFAVIEPGTREVSVVTALAPSEIGGLVQLQYAGDYFPDGHGFRPQHLDFSLAAGTHAEVRAAYDYDLVLYRLTVTGEITDLDPTHLVEASERTLRFAYAGPGVEAAAKEHVLDAPRRIVLTTSDPRSIWNACCAIGSPREAGLLALALLVPLARRRVSRSARFRR